MSGKETDSLMLESIFLLEIFENSGILEASIPN